MPKKLDIRSNKKKPVQVSLYLSGFLFKLFLSLLLTLTVSLLAEEIIIVIAICL
jgi:hypothetical protein